MLFLSRMKLADNCCLPVYYMLVVKYSCSEERIRYNVEPVMHILPISFGLLTSLAGLFLTLFNDADLWCWIASFPKDCKDSWKHGEEGDCLRGDNSWIYRWAFYFCPLWFCILFVTIVMINIYRTVRQRELQSVAESQVETLTRSSILRRASSARRRSVGSFQFKTSLHNTTKPEERRRSSRASALNSLIMPAKMAEVFKSMTDIDFNESVRSQSDVEFVISTIEALPSARVQLVEMNQFGSKAVFTQSLLYTCAFYATFTFATVNRIVQEVTRITYFPLIFLHCLMIPLQGFFNVMVYRYYFFQRLKQRNPHMSFRELVQNSWRWTIMGPPPESKPRKASGAQHTQDRVSPSSKSNRVASQSIGERSSNLGNKSSLGFSSWLSSVTSVTGRTRQSTTIRIENQLEESAVSTKMQPEDTCLDRRNSREAQDAYLDDVSYLEDDAMDLPENGLDDTIQNIEADLLMSYGEFPNMLTEDSVMVATEFPSMIGTDSFSHIPTPGFEDDVVRHEPSETPR